MRRSLPTITLAASLGLAGCNAPPSPDNPPQPIPWGTVQPSPTITEACGDLSAAQIITHSKSGTLTARHTGPECVPVYRPFSHERIGTLAARAVFGAVCEGPTTTSWKIIYGPGYKEEGAIYLTPDFAAAYQQAVKEGTESPLHNCNQLPHAPFATE